MHENLKSEKEQLRHEKLAKRDALPVEERSGKSREIVDRLLNLTEIIKANSIFTYVSFRSEVGTHSMINSLIKQGKCVSVPFIDINKKIIIPSVIKSFKNDLVPGAFGILEPVLENLNPLPAEKIDIIIMPGAVFNEKGCRLGYGGGFYDRFLKKKRIKSYALAFDCQLVDGVPFDPEFDIKVDHIVTEKRFIKCG